MRHPTDKQLFQRKAVLASRYYASRALTLLDQPSRLEYPQNEQQLFRGMVYAHRIHRIMMPISILATERRLSKKGRYSQGYQPVWRNDFKLRAPIINCKPYRILRALYDRPTGATKLPLAIQTTLLFAYTA